LDRLTRHGFRVLALAGKELSIPWHKIDKVERDVCETELEFLGLLVMQNQLKDASAAVLQELRSANIRSLMVTGDNLLTAIAVSRDCHLLPKKTPVFIVSVDTSGNTPRLISRREGKGSSKSGVHLINFEIEQMEEVEPIRVITPVINQGDLESYLTFFYQSLYRMILPIALRV
jgi:magnesium-transporting ATPase (P-type)